jgi:IS1 family transposase
MIMDEMFTFERKKSLKRYIWTSIVVTSTGRYFYFYHLSRSRNKGALFKFNFDLPQTDRVYSDGCFSYGSVYGERAIMKKSKRTNVIENLNSQIRDKISYLVRKSKAHSKSFQWLDQRLALFFADKNLGK